MNNPKDWAEVVAEAAEQFSSIAFAAEAIRTALAGAGYVVECRRDHLDSWEEALVNLVCDGTIRSRDALTEAIRAMMAGYTIVRREDLYAALEKLDPTPKNWTLGGSDFYNCRECKAQSAIAVAGIQHLPGCFVGRLVESLRGDGKA